MPWIERILPWEVWGPNTTLEEAVRILKLNKDQWRSYKDGGAGFKIEKPNYKAVYSFWRGKFKEVWVRRVISTPMDTYFSQFKQKYGKPDCDDTIRRIVRAPNCGGNGKPNRLSIVYGPHIVETEHRECLGPCGGGTYGIYIKLHEDTPNVVFLSMINVDVYNQMMIEKRKIDQKKKKKELEF